MTGDWRASSYSLANGNCAEVAADGGTQSILVLVRDSKDQDGPVLSFAAGAWRDFTSAVRRDAYPAAARPS